jgi:hypothetical protein
MLSLASGSSEPAGHGERVMPHQNCLPSGEMFTLFLELLSRTFCQGNGPGPFRPGLLFWDQNLDPGAFSFPCGSVPSCFRTTLP